MNRVESWKRVHGNPNRIVRKYALRETDGVPFLAAVVDFYDGRWFGSVYCPNNRNYERVHVKAGSRKEAKAVVNAVLTVYEEL